MTMDERAARNAAGTADYRALIQRRRADLSAELQILVTPSPSLVCEIGCGHGHFLSAYAQSHPQELCIGLDIVGERIDRANRKRERAGLANLHFLHADARLFLEALPDSARFSRIFVLFPDPWPKSRHHKHRILQSEFFTTLARFARADTRLYFRTDYAPYFESTRETLQAHAFWAISEEPWPFEHPSVFQNRAPSFFSLVARLHSFS